MLLLLCHSQLTKNITLYQFKDVHEIVILSVDVSADGELLALRNVHVNQTRLGLEILSDVDQNLGKGRHI